MVRLTLRSLLAYIDNLLSPSDTAEFERLLSENETANNLCKRIRSVMTKTELGAPLVLDTSPFSDPNMMAEYLDNVLSAENAPDFERTCLTSDRQLAEVAACHQILTVVQIEPANVDLKWRQQVYQLPQFADIVSSGDSVQGKAPVVAPVEESANPLQNLETYAQLLTPEPESPQSEPKKGNRTLWIVVVLALVAVGWFGFAYRAKPAPQTAQNPENVTAVESTDNQKPSDSAAEETSNVSGSKSEKTVLNKDSAKEESSENATDETPTDSASETVEEPTEESADKLTDKLTDKPIEGATDDSTEGSANAPEVSDASDSDAAAPAQPAVVTISGADKAKNADKTNNVDSSDVENPDRGSAAVDPDSDSDSDLDSNSESQVKPEEETAPKEEIIELNAPKVGYFKGNDQILLQKLERGEDQQWSRISDGVGVSSNYSYLALPEFRPLIQFGSDVSVQLVGPARLRVLSRSLEEPLKLQLDFGKIILLTGKKLVRPALLSVKGQDCVWEINAPETKVTLESVLGSGLTGEPSQPRDGTQFVYYQLRGESRLIESEEKTTTIAAGTKVDAVQANWISEITEEPSWLAPSDLSIGAKSLFRQLKQGTSSAMIDMRELFNDPKKIPNQTVISSLALIGDYKTILSAMRSADGKRIWDFGFKAMQMSILASDDMAQDLKKQMEEFQMTPADMEFYDLLWMYQGSLTGNEALHLASLLENESLLLRIGAHQLLSARMKTKSGYRPEETSEKNAKFLTIIRNKVKDGLPEVSAE